MWPDGAALVRCGVFAAALSAAAAGPVGAQISALAAATPGLVTATAWQVRSDSAPVGGLANSVSLMVASGASQSIPALLNGQVNGFPAPVRLTTQWEVTSIVSVIDLVGYFTTPSSALSSGAASIPSSRVEGRMTTGRVATFAPFTQDPVGGQGVVGGTLHLFRQLIIAPFNGTGQRTDQLDLRLNLQGQPALAPGTYTGTLTLRVTAY